MLHAELRVRDDSRDRDKLYWELWGGWQAGDDKLWVNSSDLLLQVINDNNRSTTPTLFFWIPNTPHTPQLYSFISLRKAIFENRDGSRERKKNWLCLIWCSLLYLLCFCVLNRICSVLQTGFEVFSVNKYAKRPSLYFSHLDVTHPFFSVFLLACLSLAN